MDFIKQKQRIAIVGDKKESTRADHRGFTLLEVLVAMAVASIGLLSLALMQGNAIKGNSVGSKYTQATFLAQEMLERIKDGNGVSDGTFGYIDMSGDAPGLTKDSGGVAGVNERGETGGPFDIRWQVSTHTDWSRRVGVTVSWTGASDVTRTVRLVSVSRGDGN